MLNTRLAQYESYIIFHKHFLKLDKPGKYYGLLRIILC